MYDNFRKSQIKQHKNLCENCVVLKCNSCFGIHLVMTNCNYIEPLFVFMFSYKFISYIEIAIQIETSIFIM